MPLKGRPRLLIVLGFLLLSLLALTWSQKSHKIALQLDGSSTLVVPADRATISLKVSSEGSKQAKAAYQVRQTTDEILTLLRPLTLPPNRTTSTVYSKNATNTNDLDILPPIATLSVNAFSSDSHPRQSLLGEATIYTSTITITAEFRALSNGTSIADRTVMSGSEFHHLSLVLPSLAKQARTKVDYLKWFLSPEVLAAWQSKARQKAMTNALTKIADYIKPMELRFPSVHCRSFREEQTLRPYETPKRYDRRPYDHWGSGLRTQSQLVMHDEIDLSSSYGYEVERDQSEAFGLEPQSMEIGSRVDGDWVVVERDWMSALWSYVF